MGILISLSGIDGAGKSTQVDLLARDLRSKGKKIHVSEEMFGYYILKKFIFLLRKASGSPSGGPVKRNKNVILKLWFIPAFIDIWLGYIFNIIPKLKKYDYVVADRYYTDIWANLFYYGYSPNWAFEKIINFLPKQDLAFIFFVDVKKVLKRENDFPESYYYEQSKIYNRLYIYTKKRKSVKLFKLDANAMPKKVFKSLMEGIE